MLSWPDSQPFRQRERLRKIFSGDVRRIVSRFDSTKGDRYGYDCWKGPRNARGDA
jgi:hypothetical protein